MKSNIFKIDGNSVFIKVDYHTYWVYNIYSLVYIKMVHQFKEKQSERIDVKCKYKLIQIISINPKLTTYQNMFEIFVLVLKNWITT